MLEVRGPVFLLDHNGKPIQQRGQSAVETVDKTKSMVAKPISKEGRSAMVQIAKPKLDGGNKSISAKPVRKEGRLAKVQLVKSITDVGKHIKQKDIVAKMDVGKVLPRIPVVIGDKIKSLYIKRAYDPKSHSMSVKK